MHLSFEPRCEKTGQSSEFPTMSETNRTVQPQKMARDLKFGMLVAERLYYPYSETKALISFVVTIVTNEPRHVLR